MRPKNRRYPRNGEVNSWIAVIVLLGRSCEAGMGELVVLVFFCLRHELHCRLK